MSADDRFADAISNAIRLHQMGFGIVPAYSPRLDKPKRDDGLHPCSCSKGADCPSPGKHPAIPHDRTNRDGFAPYFLKDEAAIRTALSNPGTRNYGVVPPPGVDLIDLDKDALDRWLTLRGEIGSPGETLFFRTPNGYHMAYRVPDDPGGNLLGIVTRRHPGGLVIGPGSVHPSGTPYVTGGGTTAIATLAAPWRDAMTSNGRVAHRDISVLDVQVGERHGWLRDEAISYITRERLFERTPEAEERLMAHMMTFNGYLTVPKAPDEVVRAIGDPWAALQPYATLVVNGKAQQPPPDRSDILAEMQALRVVVSTARPNPDRDSQWLVRGLIRPGALIVAASQEGVGKSTIRGEIAIRGGIGSGNLFGYPAFAIQRAFKSSLLDEENGEDEEADREEAALTALGATRADLGDRYTRWSFAGADLTSAAGRARVEGVVEIDHPDLLILDTASLMVTDEWGADFKEAIRWLRQLADRNTMAVLLVVHLVKPQRDARSGNRQTGNRSVSDVMGQWSRHVDAVIVISGASGEDRVHFDVYKRVPKARLVLAQASGVWEVVGTASATPRFVLPDTVPAKAGMTILTAIADGVETLDQKAVKMGSSNFYKTVKALREAGLMGLGPPYRLTEAGQEAVHPDSTRTPQLWDEEGESDGLSTLTEVSSDST